MYVYIYMHINMCVCCVVPLYVFICFDTPAQDEVLFCGVYSIRSMIILICSVYTLQM